MCRPSLSPKLYHTSVSGLINETGGSESFQGRGVPNPSPSKTSTSFNPPQLGSGSEDFISKVADLVAKRISNSAPTTANFRATDPNWKFYSNVEPTATSEIQAPNTAPPLQFDNPIFQNDMNDKYDENALLRRVPKPSKKKAAALLKIFDERPNDVTWDSSGNIYLDEESLPNSNMFELFPYLFRKRAPKNLNGLQDLIQKLTAMGLSDMILCAKKVKEEKNVASKEVTPPDNWWYLG